MPSAQDHSGGGLVVMFIRHGWFLCCVLGAGVGPIDDGGASTGRASLTAGRPDWWAAFMARLKAEPLQSLDREWLLDPVINFRAAAVCPGWGTRFFGC